MNKQIELAKIFTRAKTLLRCLLYPSLPNNSKSI